MSQDKSNTQPNLKWELLKTEHLVQDEWIDFRRLTYRMPDGSIFTPYYNYSRRNYVVIVASDEAGRFLCVRQYRQGIGEVTTEFPAGGIEKAKDADDVSEDAALAAAKRELQEETGYTSDDWRHLLTIPSDATISDNYAHIYRAKNCRRVSGQDLDETEFLNAALLSKDEIENLIQTGGFQQAVHVMAWLLAERQA